MVNPSRFLYRYYSNFEYVLDTIINRRIYFPSPEELNDPFDCHLKFSLLHCKKDPEADWKLYFFYLAKSQYNGISDEEACKHADAAINKKLHKNNDWLLKADQSIKDSIDESLKDFRICSFSKSPRNQMMWAHYADNHKGMVLQFRASHFRDRGFDIDYYKQPIPLKKYVDAFKNTLEGDETAYARLIWCSKSDEWSGEKEVRLFSKNKYNEYPEEMLSGILIGSECSSLRIDLLRKSISSLKKKPKIFKEAPERSSLIKRYFSLLAK
jgi:hypothetical protein